MPPSRANKNPAAPATAPKAKSKRLKVRAVNPSNNGICGYYDHARRREGDVFIIEEADFSERWMEKVANNTPESLTTAQQAIDKEHDAILAAKQPLTPKDQEGL